MTLPGLSYMRDSYASLVCYDQVSVLRKPLQQLDGVYDPNTGKYHDSVVDERLIYTGPARVMRSGRTARETQEIDDGTHQVLNRYELVLPFGSPAMQTGYLVTVTASDNPALVDETFTVLSPTEETTSLAVRAIMTRRENNRDGN